MRRAAASLPAFLLAGCCCSPFPDVFADYTETRPDAGDIVGTWQATAATLDSVARWGYDGFGRSRLILRSDGTFTMADMPDCWRGSSVEAGSGAFESGGGEWVLAPRGGRWEVELRFDRPPWFPAGGYATSLALRHQEPPYVLRTFIGDPDQFEILEFERQ